MKKLIILLLWLQINILLANELNYPPILIEGFRVLKQQNLETPEFKDFAAEVLQQETDKLNDLWDHNRDEYCNYRKTLAMINDPIYNAMYVDDMLSYTASHGASDEEKDVFDGCGIISPRSAITKI